ncbi:hypothetical protein B0H94_104153 [Salsuginibacillus halophilus]|uniref:Secreted protein n=1 Tax=Salsuginibacillus halophilus TaxID=517424 RepID=A0A2P8HQT7_9BACI|nr:hypothetical protein [Salsuginibacillus halophilus]PSL48552.1 hypothetical protein B0H94_104153 [Salsuginibacillus halophilus]
MRTIRLLPAVLVMLFAMSACFSVEEEQPGEEDTPGEEYYEPEVDEPDGSDMLDDDDTEEFEEAPEE